MSPDIVFHEGDTSPIVGPATLMAKGAAIDLTGATVTFRYRDKDSTDNADTVIESASIVGDSTDGTVEWHPATPVPAGDFFAYWHVVLPGGDVLTDPNSRDLWMSVRPAL